MNKRLTLFTTFFKIGAFTFGGGYAMIPLIQKEMVERHQWISDQDLLDMIAIAESTPGPIAVNSATFVGYHTAGFWGAVLATTGVVLPSFLVILLISMILPQFEHQFFVKAAFFGIRAGILAMILKACLSMYKACEKSWFSYLVMILAFIAITFFKLNAIYIIVVMAICGIGYFSWIKERIV